MTVHPMLREAFRYGLASVAAFIVDVAVLTALIQWAHWHYAVAATVSFIIGGLVSYALCVRFVFRSRRFHNSAVEAPYFLALGLIGLPVNVAVISFLVETFAAHVLIAKTIAAGCTFAVNFLLRRTILFSPPKQSRIP